MVLNELIRNYVWTQADDSTGTKLAGSVINAVIFVVIVGVMTFVLVLLFKYGVRFTIRLKRTSWCGVTCLSFLLLMIYCSWRGL